MTNGSVIHGAAARTAAVVVCGLLALALISCGPSDPRQKVLDERGRWDVQLDSWAPGGGEIQASLTVSGPVKPKIETLTVRFALVDAAGGVLQDFWRPLDVTRVERGAPTEMLVRLSTDLIDYEGLTVEIVNDPTPEQAAKIAELAGL